MASCSPAPNDLHWPYKLLMAALNLMLWPIKVNHTHPLAGPQKGPVTRTREISSGLLFVCFHRTISKFVICLSLRGVALEVLR